MKKSTTIISLASLALLTGCDVSWQAVSAALAVASGEPGLAIIAVSNLDNDHGSWWENNDEHFDWAWWPFN